MCSLLIIPLDVQHFTNKTVLIKWYYNNQQEKIPVRKNWLSVNSQVHIEPTPIPLLKCDIERKDTKSYYVKVKFCIDPDSATSDMYEYNVALFENIKL